MNRATLLTLAAALALSAGVPRSDDLAEAAASHDKHPGLIDAPDHDDDHRHGDADDHHNGPDAPCHHHEMHLCCAQAPALLAASVDRLTISMTWQYFTALAPWTRATLDLRTPFHVPLA